MLPAAALALAAGCQRLLQSELYLHRTAAQLLLGIKGRADSDKQQGGYSRHSCDLLGILYPIDQGAASINGPEQPWAPDKRMIPAGRPT